MDPGRLEHLKMLQAIISRMATCSFQLKAWSVTLAGALLIFAKREAGPEFVFIPAIPITAFWLLDAFYLRQERLFRKLYDLVRQQAGASDFSMSTAPVVGQVASLWSVAASGTIIGFYFPFLLVACMASWVVTHTG